MISPPPLKDIKYSLEIDEEGYPIFSGLRIHDEEVLVDIFGNLQRSISGEARAKLLTCLEKKNWAWIDAFDAPLVAQSVTASGPDHYELEFLGGLRERVALKDFEIDEWHRFHCLATPAQIPAVLSRKAHAAFLNMLAAKDVEESQFRRFREPQKGAPETREYWSEAYREKQDGWELGEAHPSLVATDLSRFAGAKVLVPGAGRGHDAAHWAKLLPASHVTALDFAPEAKLAADATYHSLTNLHFETKDVFAFLATQTEASLDVVFEHTFFCAIDPRQRADYVREVTRVLKPGGIWMGVYFLLEHEGGAPFALTQWELREFTRANFEIRAWKRIAASPKGRLHKELWAEFSKRSI